MPETSALAKTEISDWLKSSGRDREWLATQLKVSLSIVNQWLAPKGSIPEDRLASIRQIMERESAPPLIGDPEGNLLSFTIEEFEKIEETRRRLHYETRPALYRDAILAYVEAEDAPSAKVVPFDQAAETPTAPPVTEERHEVRYEKPAKKKK